MKLDFFEQKKAMGQLRKKGDAYRITHSRRPRGGGGGVSRAGLKGATKVFKHGLMCLKTFVAPFLPARLTAPGSPRIRITRQWHFDYNYSLCTIMDKKRPKTHLHLWGFFQLGIQFLACKVNIYTSGTFWCGK